MKTLKPIQNLEQQRRRRADRVFDAIYMNGESIEDHDGWEFVSGSKENRPVAWKKRVYLRNTEDSLGDSIPSVFTLVFEANTAEPIGASLAGKHLSLP